MLYDKPEFEIENNDDNEQKIKECININENLKSINKDNLNEINKSLYESINLIKSLLDIDLTDKHQELIAIITKNNYLDKLKNYLTYAKKQELINSNPDFIKILMN